MIANRPLSDAGNMPSATRYGTPTRAIRPLEPNTRSCAAMTALGLGSQTQSLPTQERRTRIWTRRPRQPLKISSSSTSRSER